jgi:hypothetical protein
MTVTIGNVDVLVPLALLAAVLSPVFTRALRGLREPRIDQSGDEPRVTLAVLPGRRAVVTVDAEPEPASGVADLVDEAVREALTLDGVDRVEVRRADGELLERRLKPTPEGRTMPMPAVLKAGRHWRSVTQTYQTDPTTRHHRDCSTPDAGP